jgi:hypothetical protein
MTGNSRRNIMENWSEVLESGYAVLGQAEESGQAVTVSVLVALVALAMSGLGQWYARRSAGRD